MTSPQRRMLEASIKVFQEDLWKAQLANYPDSELVPIGEALSWLHETPDVDALAEEFKSNPLNGGFDSEIRRAIARDRFIDHRIHEHRLRMATCIALSLSYPGGVFYRCGMREDGSFKWRGYRYDVRDAAYMSGFPSPDGRWE